jgi:hypothetical protein
MYLFTGESWINTAGPGSSSFLVQGGLPQGPGQVPSMARATFLRVQHRLPPWPGPPARDGCYATAMNQTVIRCAECVGIFSIIAVEYWKYLDS